MSYLGMGSLVRLKSGGVLMTAVEFPKQGRELTGMVVCAWVAADGTPHRVAYPEIALEVLIPEARVLQAGRIVAQAREAEQSTQAAEKAN
jgi:uncharacterized protein YodC (DUF2158 family)